MLIEQNVELRGPGPPGRTCTHDKTKISQGKSWRGLLLTAKILQEAMFLTSPYLDK